MTERPARALPAPLLAVAPAAEAAGTPPLITPDKKMIFGALTTTPGGFFAAEYVFRSSATNA